MELLKLVNGFKEVLNIKNVEDAQQRLMAVLFDYKEKEKLYYGTADDVKSGIASKVSLAFVAAGR